MGTCLDAAVQVKTKQDAWDTVATFEFNKDYTLQLHLGEHWRHVYTSDRDTYWPWETEDCGQRYICEYPECHTHLLPSDVYSLEELDQGFGLRLQALLDVCERMNVSDVRVLFWTDQ